MIFLQPLRHFLRFSGQAAFVQFCHYAVGGVLNLSMQAHAVHCAESHFDVMKTDLVLPGQNTGAPGLQVHLTRFWMLAILTGVREFFKGLGRSGIITGRH